MEKSCNGNEKNKNELLVLKPMKVNNEEMYGIVKASSA